jgi:hypothetical protein
MSSQKSGDDIFNMTKDENDLAVFKGFMLYNVSNVKKLTTIPNPPLGKFFQ